MPAITARWATAAEIAQWDDLVAGNASGSDFILSKTFAEGKELLGWKARYAVFESDETGDQKTVATVLERSIPVLGKFWYVPRGPGARDAAELASYVQALRDLVRTGRHRVFGITLEPPIALTGETTEAQRREIDALLETVPALNERAEIQGSTHTVIVPLTDEAGDPIGDDALLASYQKKSRNMVRRADRDGHRVIEYPPTRETYDRMHELMRMVGGGNKEGLMIRPKNYVEALWDGYTAKGQGKFYGIDVDGVAAVMAFVIKIGDTATYKDGGSDRPRSTPGMSNLLQYEIMRAMRDAGAKRYDLFGVAPLYAKSAAEHSAYEFGRFKLTFGPRATFAGAFELPLKPLQWKIWKRIGARVTDYVHRRKYNDFWLF